MPRKSVPCKRCGKPLAVGRGSRPDPTCRPCRRVHREPYGARDTTPPDRTFVCGHCARETAVMHDGQRFCSRSCVSESRRAPSVTCEVCQSQFWPGKDRRKLCSRRCAVALRSIRANAARACRPPRAPAPRPPRPCSVCGSAMPPAKRSYCSYTCRIQTCGERVLDLYRLACGHGWSGAGWRKLLVGYLRERDGDDCRICRKAIRYDIPSGPRGDPSGLGHSIDHVVPRSQDGGDELANLRLTHWRCNRERKAKGGNEQLLLIG